MTPDESHLLDELRELMRSITQKNIPVLAPDLELVLLPLDSLDRVRIVSALEERYGVEIDEATAARVRTVRDLLWCMVARRR